MANKLYDQMTGEVSIGAGTKVNEERQGMKIGEVKGAENMIPCMEEIGIDISNSEIKQVTQEMVNWADKIIIMTSKENVPEFALENKRIEFWEIKDPKGTDLESHCKTREEIKKRIEELIANKL